MNHRKFVVTSTVSMLVIAGVVLGLAFYSNFAVKAAMSGLPEALNYLPADSQVIFGMNVQKFVSSPIFLKFQQQHGQEIGSDLQEFISKTGVDPTRDISYILAAGRSVQGQKGSGVVIALGRFNTDAITSFIKTKAVPIELDYAGVHVMMIPEGDGSKLEKGVAFLKSSEIALGDLDSLKAVIDVVSGKVKGVASNPVLAPLLSLMNPNEMFWFAGDAASVLSKAPTNTPFGGSVSAIQNIVGTLNLDEAIVGRITATAKDPDSAKKLADVVNGLKALGQLAAGDQNPDLVALLNGVTISQSGSQVGLSLNFPYDLLERLQQAKPQFKKI
jgi:hypothetical protein